MSDLGRELTAPSSYITTGQEEAHYSKEYTLIGYTCSKALLNIHDLLPRTQALL